ncbi:MAG: T9SS type A sorting domain-containing protein [Saprospiraceae bacterium]
MLTTLQRLKVFILLITLTCFGQLQAQDCDQLGVVSRGFLLGKFNCEVLIVSANGAAMFQPSKLSDELVPGQLIRFSYTLLDSTACDEEVPLININCIESLFDPNGIGENTCNFDIESVALADSNNSFQLEVFNQTDFGDFYPQMVNWYEYETSKQLGTTPTIVYTPTATSPPTINICADITVAIPNSDLCTSMICHTIVPETIFPEETSCQALFIYQPADQLSDNGTINFYNLSYGDYDKIEWNFGDNQTDTTNDLTITHVYNTPGLYEVCVTVEHQESGCFSSFCLPVFTVGGSEICGYNDCVFPGDANDDDLVNIFDVLNLGIGFNKLGEIRPNASITPILQAAFDWEFFTFFDLDFKHIDCDGNGVVSVADYAAIDQNYQKITTQKDFEVDATLPEVSLVFPANSILINPNQTEVSIPVDLVVGANGLAVDNLYGIALAVNYDKSLIKDIQTTYDPTSFIGNTEETLVREKLLTGEGQVGYAITRTDQFGVNGSGNIAEFALILDLDLILGRSESVLELDIIDLIVVDSSGREIPVTVTDDNPDVTIIFDENALTNTAEQLLTKQFEIYPNPVKDELTIDLAKDLDLTNGRIEIFNTLGQKVVEQAIANHQTILPASTLASGVYWVKVAIEDGIGIRALVVE